MTRALHDALSRLISIAKDKDFENILNDNLNETLKMRKVKFKDVCNSSYFSEIKFLCKEQDSVQWKFVSVLSYLLLNVENILKNNADELLSVSFQTCIKSSFEFIIPIGILPTLIPGTGIPIEKRTEFGYLYKVENLTPMQKYDRLKSMCNLFNRLCNLSDLKTIIYSNFLKDYLAVLYQLGYAPIVKPGFTKLFGNIKFTMTEELWKEYKKDQAYYRTILDTIISKCYKPLIIRELLVLQGVQDPPPPIFMRKTLSRELSTILVSKDGLLHTMKCFFDCSSIDVGSQWKHIDVIKRLISVKHGSLTIQDYLSNICNQIKEIIETQNNKDYIIVTAACIANLYEQYPDNDSILEVINTIIRPLLLNNENLITGTLLLSAVEVNKLIKTLDLCFNQSKLSLPSYLLTPIICHLFGLRIFCPKPMKSCLNNLIIKNFLSKICRSNDWFDTLVFKNHDIEIIVNKDVMFEATSEGVQIKYLSNGSNITVEAALNCILEIIDKGTDTKEFAHSFYVFCLTSLMKFSSDIAKASSKELLINEDEPQDLISKESEYVLVLLHTLGRLLQFDFILNSFKDDPSMVVEFISSTLKDYTNSLNNNVEYKNEECIMMGLTLLSVILKRNPSNDAFKLSLTPITEYMDVIKYKCKHLGIDFICRELKSLLPPKSSFPKVSYAFSQKESEFEKAVSELTDPLLPVRAHGLMHLTKLIEDNDLETIFKKHYVQCILEENLKSEDSYLYLAAINGLVALVNHSTKDVLEVLTREFSNSKKELRDLENEENEAIQIRMKIGEVLVKVTKNLGETAAKYKTLLLNTFLVGCKDSDPLLRASSLSNLAELCEVLSYNLGPVLYELLICINSILETDKSQECRRASVMIVTSLLKGLERQNLYFLRESLVPIYRTLKRLYNNRSEDETVRLHAQIGLEELNNIVRGLLYTPVKMEKKIVMKKRK